jgi:hypothetical protein
MAQLKTEKPNMKLCDWHYHLQLLLNLLQFIVLWIVLVIGIITCLTKHTSLSQTSFNLHHHEPLFVSITREISLRQSDLAQSGQLDRSEYLIVLVRGSNPLCVSPDRAHNIAPQIK